MDKEENKNAANGEEQQKSNCEIIKKINQIEDDAGPSGFMDIPGLVPHSSLSHTKTGLSKSEHNLRQIITAKDVATALTLSFGTQNAVKNVDFKEVNRPIPTQQDATTKTVDDSTTVVDLKNFMATCFNLNMDVPKTTLIGVANIQTIQTTVNPIVNEIPENTTTENLVKSSVKVIYKNAQPVDSEVSKCDSDKKKTSENISEKSAEFPVAQRDSLSSIGSNVCRICMTRGRERLISPCNCKGSLANVHLSCLERWLNQVGRNHCELCGYSYPAIRTPRYTVLQALRLWFGNPRNRSHLQSDCLIFWLLSTVTAGLLAVCIVGTQYFVIEGTKFGKIDAALRKEEGISHRITETAMDFFMAVVLCGYSVTVYLLWKDHYLMWNRWRRANVNVRLLLAPDSNPVPFTPRARYNMV